MPRDDVPGIKQQLLADVPGLLSTLFRERKVARLYGEHRVGTHGALSVREDGQWYCHESGAGGDVFDLIAFALATDFKGALAFAKGYLGQASKVIPFPKSSARLSEAQDANRQRQKAKARWLWNQAQPVTFEGGDHAGS
jgi:hypothetical protein